MKDKRLLNEKALEIVVGGQDDSNEKGPGLKCPSCNGWITITIYDIKNNDAIYCPHCGLKIPIERTNSNKAIDALRKVQEAQDKLNNKAV